MNATQQAAATPSAAPDPPDNIFSVLDGAKLAGVVDTYYSFNANQAASHNSGFRAFDGPADQFALNLVELTLARTPDAEHRLGFDVALGFGQAMNAVNGSEPGFAQNLKEVFFSYLVPVGKGLQIDVGKFVTSDGAEVIESNQDLNYSRGLLFTYAIPYYHLGIRARYTFNSKCSLTGLAVNGYNNMVDSAGGKTGGLSFSWSPGKRISITENWLGGPGATSTDPGWRNLFDTVVTYLPTSKLSLVVNGDYGRSRHPTGFTGPVDWSGIAGYIHYQLDPRYALTTRYEYYNDHTGFTTGTAQHISELTGTLERRIASHLITRLEFRHDLSNRPSFERGAGKQAATGQSTVSAGLMYVLEPAR